MSTAWYPRRPSLLEPQVNSSPAEVIAAVWCLAAATETTRRLEKKAVLCGRMTALSPLWM